MPKNFHIGQKIETLDDNITGKVTAISNQNITIETQEGFEMSFLEKELIAVETSSTLKKVTKDETQYAFNESKISKSSMKIRQKEKEVKTTVIPEIDLHIEKLVYTTKGMSNYDILITQIETAVNFIKKNIHKRQTKIVLIHGKGQGVLKQALYDELERYDNLMIKDANPKYYGDDGAMEICILQNTKYAKVNRYCKPFLLE